MRVNDLLTEGKRQKGLNYETILKGKAGEIDKVLVKLDGAQSAKFTKLASQYKELQGEVKELQAKLANNQDTIRAHMEELFDPADEVLTRVVETCALTLQLAKMVPPSSTTSTNYEKSFNELVKLIGSMVPDLKDQMESLVECAKKAGEETKTSAGRKSAFTVKEGFLDGLAALVKAVRTRLAKWIGGYDVKLRKAKADMEKLKLMQTKGVPSREFRKAKAAG